MDMDVDSGDVQWIKWFLKSKTNEWFCEVDVEFITDRFNLTGLQTEVENMHRAIETITRPVDGEPQDDAAPEERRLDTDARHLYGLIHARYILTSRGLQKMMEKYNEADFGRCPRALCRSQPLLPIGLHDVPHQSRAKLYCPKCEDIYNPKSARQANLDSAYFGTTFPGMLLQVYPKLVPRRTNEQFTLKVFGFKVYENAELARWQQKQREEMEQRLTGNATR